MGPLSQGDRWGGGDKPSAPRWPWTPRVGRDAARRDIGTEHSRWDWALEVPVSCTHMATLCFHGAGVRQVCLYGLEGGGWQGSH